MVLFGHTSVRTVSTPPPLSICNHQQPDVNQVKMDPGDLWEYRLRLFRVHAPSPHACKKSLSPLVFATIGSWYSQHSFYFRDLIHFG